MLSLLQKPSIVHVTKLTLNTMLSSFADTKEGRYNPKMDPVIPVNNWRKGSQVILLPAKPAHIVRRGSTIFV